MIEDLKKVNSMEIYELWKSYTASWAAVTFTVAFSWLLPFYLNPIVSLLCSAGLYTMLYNSRLENRARCMLVPFAIFYCLVIYTFVSILLNVLYAWGVIVVPREFVFFGDPYVPSLILFPVCFLTLMVISLRRRSLTLCINCRLNNGESVERGRFGQILRMEWHIQIKSMIWISGILSLIVWIYYLTFYTSMADVRVNDRSWFVFTWVPVIALVFDEIYFTMRYYNLYLDLKENDEIITPEEIQDMTAHTYVRFYVVCGEKMYIDPHSIDINTPYREVLDTPFHTKRAVNGIPMVEVRQIIRRMTGVDGELRFFYGRKSPDLVKYSVLRYFYFVEPDADGKCPDLGDPNAEWVDFGKVKYIYQYSPTRMSRIACIDLSRLCTIMITEKIFDENGYRKSKIRTYNPNFTLEDVRKSELDFQDDKWIRISLFNADTKMFKVKKWWKQLTGKSNNKRQWQ